MKKVACNNASWKAANQNKAYYANQFLFKSRLVSKKSKMKLYWNIIRPIRVVKCACEIWVLKETIKNKLMLFEREA
jgi:hypothetical protein